MAWHEAYVYKKNAPIFKDYLELLGAFKIKFSGFSPDISSDEEKDQYCEQVNDFMGFTDDRLRLTRTNVEHNEQMRSAFKLMSNCKYLFFL